MRASAALTHAGVAGSEEAEEKMKKKREGGSSRVFPVVHAMRYTREAEKTDDVSLGGERIAPIAGEDVGQTDTPHSRAGSDRAPPRWCGSTVMLSPHASAVLSEVMAMTERHELRCGSSMGLVCTMIRDNVSVMMDLAIALRARFVAMAGLMNDPAASEALTRYVEVQHDSNHVKAHPVVAAAHSWSTCGRSSIDAYRAMSRDKERADGGEEDEEDEDEPVPEIRRKNDKKKRKGNRHS